MTTLQLPATFSSPQDADKATQSNYTQVIVKHTHLEWTIDWTGRIFHGHAVLSFVAKGDAEKVVLDTSYLDIQKVKVQGKEVKFDVGERIGTIGSALSFSLPERVSSGSVSEASICSSSIIHSKYPHKTQDSTLTYQTFDVKITYSTTKDCTAVGWLEPVQTKSGKYPYLYSQSQAVSCLTPKDRIVSNLR